MDTILYHVTSQKIIKSDSVNVIIYQQSALIGLWCDPHVLLTRGNLLHMMEREHLSGIFIIDTSLNHTLVTILCEKYLIHLWQDGQVSLIINIQTMPF